jgi:excinuclease ABC subunit C
VIVQRAVSGDAASLFPLFQGRVLAPLRLDLGGHPAQISLDRQVREAIDEAELTPAADLAERQDSLALLRRWLYSSWRQGEFVVFEGFDRIPYRKVVNAISRVVSGRPDAAVATAAMRRAAKQGPSTSSDQSGNLS